MNSLHGDRVLRRKSSDHRESVSGEGGERLEIGLRERKGNVSWREEGEGKRRAQRVGLVWTDLNPCSSRRVRASDRQDGRRIGGHAFRNRVVVVGG